MDSELLRRVEALRRPLELAAKDGFAGVRTISGLGTALRIACDGVIAKAPSDAFANWRDRLGAWDHLDPTQREIVVASGMRLLARFPQRQSYTALRRGPTIASLLATPPRDRDPGHREESGSSGATAPRAIAHHAPADPPSRRATAPRAIDVKLSTLSERRATVSRAIDAKPSTPSRRRAAASRAIDHNQPVDPLAAATHSLPGIGPAFAERLAAHGIATVEDLLWCLPRRYDDVRNAHPLAGIAAIPDGTRATFVAAVTSARMIFARGRRWGEVRLTACEGSEPATALVRFFNIWGGIDQRLPAGSVVTLSGAVRRRGKALEFANPDIVAIDRPPPCVALPSSLDDSAGHPELAAEAGGAVAHDASPARAKPVPTIIARYPDVRGVPANRLRVACQTACARVGAMAADGVPIAVEQAAGLPNLAEALSQLHAPRADISSEELDALNHNTSRWQRRLVFGELFVLGVSVALKRRERRSDAAMPCPRSSDYDRALASAVPFALTGAQARVIREVGDDLQRASPMNRLLQGDVGSGKTCVAFAAALQVAQAGRQTAVMAPTEILAEQHAATWRTWATSVGLRVELLTASTPRAVRQSMMAMVANRQLDVVIGTHALLAEGVGFGALGLVVIDEQHRFGVAQRARLRDKGDGQGAPHLLVMTATPIPRTLALTAYGDLDVSVLDELPPGRKPVTTSVVRGKRGETSAYKLISDAAVRGEQSYLVCPKIDNPEIDKTGQPDSASWKDATTVAAEVARAVPELRVGLVHGRLDTEDRDRVMQAFKRGALDVLVATTVIEVGVDVPAATTMIVHNAERFGLAQLHQLRGRVGRGGVASRCILITHGTISDEGQHRLDALARTTDGFAIAEVDLELRGPGELCGPRQAGTSRLRFGDLAQNIELLLEARRHADTVLADDPQLCRPEHAALRAALERKLSSTVYGAEGG